MNNTESSERLSIIPKAVFGLRTDVIENIHFANDETIIYPVASVLVFVHEKTRKRKYLRLIDGSIPIFLAVSPNKKWLAIIEKATKGTFINIHEVATLKRRRSVNYTKSAWRKPAAISFTYDSRSFVVLSNTPRTEVTIYALDQEEPYFQNVVDSIPKSGCAKYVSCNPGDGLLIALGGDNVLQVLTRNESSFSTVGTVRGEHTMVTSIVWLTQDILLVGNNLCELIFVEGGDMKAKYSATDTALIDLTKEEFTWENLNVSENAETPVNCLINFKRGFAYVIENKIYVYEKETSFKFVKRLVANIPHDDFQPEGYAIANMALNETSYTIVVTTTNGQIFAVSLQNFGQFENSSVNYEECEIFEQYFHSNGILNISMCTWRPIIVTSSKDGSVRIWNYDSLEIELIKNYQTPVFGLSLHPFGTFVAIGFWDRLRLFQIELSNLKLLKDYNFPACQAIEFSHQGHLLAVANRNKIFLINAISYGILHTLIGHQDTVSCLVWSSNDSELVSAGEEGSIYHWNSRTGYRMSELVVKGSKYLGITLSPDGKTCFTLLENGILWEIQNSNIVREIYVPDTNETTSLVKCLAMAKSDQFMFVGTAKGGLYHVQCPFNKSQGGKTTNLRFFHKAVNSLKINHTEKLLVTGSDDGTLVIWKILSINENIGKEKEFFAVSASWAVVTSQREVQQKDAAIDKLKLRIMLQAKEFQHRIKHGDAFHSEEMREIHTKYCSIIEKLKHKYDDTKAEFLEKLGKCEIEMRELEEKSYKDAEKLERGFCNNIVFENERSMLIRNDKELMKRNYDLRILKSAQTLQNTIFSLEAFRTEQFEEKTAIISDLMKLIEEYKKEFLNYCKEMELENHKNINDLQMKYQGRVKKVVDKNKNLESNCGVLKKKFFQINENCACVTKNTDILKKQIENSKMKIKKIGSFIAGLKETISNLQETNLEQEKINLKAQRNNTELEKIRQALNHKVLDLKYQMEPLLEKLVECQKNEAEWLKEGGKCCIYRKESKFKNVELQERVDKSVANLQAMKKNRYKAQVQLNHFLTDAHEAVALIQNNVEFGTAVSELCRKYIDPEEMFDPKVLDEFTRHREHIESLLHTENKAKEKLKLMDENRYLKMELEKLTERLGGSKKEFSSLQELFGISKKFLSNNLADSMIEKALVSNDVINQQYEQRINSLKHKKETMQTQIHRK